VADLVTLPKHESFTTDDPEALKEELERAYQDIVAELAALAEQVEWNAELALETVVAAHVRGAVVCLDVDVTVRPPTNAQPGNCFRVVRAGTGNIVVAPDDGTLVDGAATGTLNLPGCREYMFARGGWWSLQ
jgi:hypothetical protein